MAIFMIVLLTGWHIVDSSSNNKYSGVPKINIILNNDTTLQDINSSSKDIEYEGNKLLLEYGGEKMEINDVNIKGRGNMSWLMDKKSYRIKFPSKMDFLSQQKIKKVALVANSLDDTFLRNDLAYYIARIVNDKYPVNGDFVDLSVSDEYVGLYYAVNLIDIGKNGVDLRNSRGVLAELDNAYCSEGVRWRVTKASKDCIAIKDIVKENEEAEIVEESFFDSYELFEKAVIDGNFEEASLYGDMDSWVEYYLVGEFAANLDMAITSLKMYQDGPEDKIHAVTAWDFDWAFGNKNWNGTQDPRVLMMRYKILFPEKADYESSGGDCRFMMDEGSDEAKELLSMMVCHLIDMPEFRKKVAETYYDKLQNKRQEISNYIQDRAALIRESAVRDNEKWGKRDFDEEVEYLLWWVNERFNYFDEIMMSF